MSRRLRFTIVLMALALVAAACGDDGADPASSTTTAAAAASTTLAPATTVAPTTTAAPATTTAPTTTTTTAPPTTTTTAPPPPILFEVDGIGIAQFGQSDAVVVPIVEAVFGPPTADSGWIASGFTDYGVCPGSEYRRVAFNGGDFVVQFTDAGYFAAEGTRQFFAYGWFGGAPGPTPGPPESLDAGSSVQDIMNMYPAAEFYSDDPFFGDTFRVSGIGWEQLWGRLTGGAPADQIIAITGGSGCGE